MKSSKVTYFRHFFGKKVFGFSCSVDGLLLNPWPIYSSLFFLISHINIAFVFSMFIGVNDFYVFLLLNYNLID